MCCYLNADCSPPAVIPCHTQLSSQEAGCLTVLISRITSHLRAWDWVDGTGWAFPAQTTLLNSQPPVSWETTELQGSCSAAVPSGVPLLEDLRHSPWPALETLTSMQNSSWHPDSKAFRKDPLNKSNEQKWKFGTHKSSILILKWQS